MSNIDMAMKLDSYSRREESRKKLFKWSLGVILIMVLILCPFGLLVLYLMGMDEMLTLFWAIIMFTAEILAVVLSTIRSRHMKKYKNSDIKVSDVDHNINENEIKRTGKDFDEFWKKWEYFDNEKNPEK